MYTYITKYSKLTAKSLLLFEKFVLGSCDGFTLPVATIA